MDKNNIVYKELNEIEGIWRNEAAFLKSDLIDALQKIKEDLEKSLRVGSSIEVIRKVKEGKIEAYQEIIDALNFKE